MAFELLALRRPFVAKDFEELAERVKSADYGAPALKALAEADHPPALKALPEQLLRVEPAERMTLPQLAVALEQAKESVQTAAASLPQT